MEKLNEADWMEDIAILLELLVRALTPLPSCGHPAGCVVSVPYIDGVGASNVCGWCATESRFREAIGLAATAVAERDDLREKLAAAENIADRCISALDDILEHVPTGYITTEIENTFTVGLAWRAAK